MSLAPLLNSIWMLGCSREEFAFRRATLQVEETQTQILREILYRNRKSEFGVRHGFADVKTPRDFQRRVPPATFEDYQHDIERIGRGAPNVLTAEPVTLFEPTSGTSGAEKLIPYTRALRAQFQRAISAWIGDLYRARPKVRRGRAYWSISPAFGPTRRTPAGIPIGFEDDTAYLSHLERAVIKNVLATPSCLRLIPDIAAFRYCTLLSLLRSADLSLISIWNPRFLIALLEPLEKWGDQLCADLRDGECNPAGVLPAIIRHEMSRHSRPDKRRADRVASVLRSKASLADKLAEIWPQLALISCWADAAAARQIIRLKQLFPAVELQPKGLLATEAFVSFPMANRPGAALAVRSHFFEFEECDPCATSESHTLQLRLAHELEPSRRYRVLATTGGGLYRYQLRDEVEIVGYEGECPLLKFIGKSDQVSDLVGEKLSEPCVREALDSVLEENGLSPSFALVAPIEEDVPGYCLFIQDGQLSAGISRRIAHDLQKLLEANPHYRYAVGLNQLGPLRIHELDPGGESAWTIYERKQIARGQKAGDIKPLALDRNSDWKAEFESLLDHSHLERRIIR